MDDEQAMRDAWETLLAAHGELVSVYVQALGTRRADQIGRQVRSFTIQALAISDLLALPWEGKPAW